MLIAVRDSVLPLKDLRWCEILPGRMIHLRCCGGKQQFDMLCVYQHTLGLKGQDEDKIFRQRSTIWHKLDRWLCATPVRSELVIAGDLNITLRSQPRVCGQGVPRRQYREAGKQDLEILMQILSKHKLCAANTWGKKAACYTNRHPGGNTQIDYVLVRQANADLIAKRSSHTHRDGWLAKGRPRADILQPAGEMDALDSV